MAWVKLDDGFDEHIKLASCSDYDAALSAFVQLICYSARNLTDGRIPGGIAARKNKKAIAELVRVGLLERDGRDLIVHDYLEYNPSREETLQAREVTRQRKAAWREKSRKVSRRDNPQDNHRSSQGLSQGLSTLPPSPSPSPTPRTGSSDREVVDESTSSSACGVSRDCRSTSSIQSAVLGYWSGKTGRDPSEAEARSLRSLCRRFPAGIVCLAIGQAVVQGEPADNFALITTIAKAAAKQ